MQNDPVLRATFKLIRAICVFMAAVVGTAAVTAFVIITLVMGPGYWTLKTAAPVFFTAVLAVLLALVSRQFKTA